MLDPAKYRLASRVWVKQIRPAHGVSRRVKPGWGRIEFIAGARPGSLCCVRMEANPSWYLACVDPNTDLGDPFIDACQDVLNSLP